ncbi:uncharacterized protein [Procambarus clarkii]|uniref:uncharacterized protein isoform X2 n=1 Tax=Procambarus clarkii TaxID=6728 RepID=UPI001E671D55|nr:uncharacterized protein LOC123759681 isoform X2 [Procambarus clarkii]
MSQNSSSNNIQNGRWVENSAPGFSSGLMYQDFLPLKDPDNSTCWSTSYQSFSETVQHANEWLGRHEGYEILGCESLACTPSEMPSYLADSWPTTTHIRGLRLWLRGPGEDTSSSVTGRFLLSYRDFTPYLDRKNLFSRDYEDTGVLLERLNQYLENRTSRVRILAVETLDTPMSGVLDIEVDTEKSSLTFSQHGFTKYCRSLRVFFVTQYQKRPQEGQGYDVIPRICLLDFVPKNKPDKFISGEETVTEMMQRALRWCSTTKGVTLLNLQVLPAKAGRTTTASTWMLENPGHVFNKFFSFVRIAYTEGEVTEVTEESAGGEAAGEATGEAVDEVAPESTVEDDVPRDDQDTVAEVMSLPGVVSVAALRPPSGPLTGLHCKTFLPKQLTAGGACRHSEWEPLEETVSRLNSWVDACQGVLVNIHTRYAYTQGRSGTVDPEASSWVKHLTGGGQVAVLHLVIRGGRSPTALPARHQEPTPTCVIL